MSMLDPKLRLHRRGVFAAAISTGFLLLLLGASGCRGGKKPPPAAAPGGGASASPPPTVYLDERVPGEKKDEGDWLVRALDSDCGTLNYVLYTLQYEYEVLNYIHRNVVDVDARLDVQPGLAERWEISDDRRTYTFHLRKDATWEDGKPVTAEDFDFTIKTILDPNVPSPNKKPVFDGFESAEVVDPQTYRIRFKTPFAGRLAGCFNLGLLPKHVYGTGDFLSHPANRKPVGNGPYRFVRWETNKEIELVRREDYWGPKPAFRKILFKILPDQAVRLSALKTGQIDETRISAIQWRDVESDPAFNAENRTIMFHALATPNFIAWNLRNPLLSDSRVRQALAMLVDRDRISKNLYFGTAEPAAGIFPWGSWGRNPNVRPWPFDPPAAKKKLEEAGWKDTNGDGNIDREGKEFAFEMMIPAGSVISEQVGTLFQGELRRVGIRMELRSYEYSVMQQRVDSGQFEAAFQSLMTDVDPDPSLLLHSKQIPPAGLNFGYFQNAEADRLIDEARVEFDQEKRKQLYWKLAEIVHQEQPACFVLHPTMKWAVSKRFRGLNLSPLGLFAHYPASLDWWVPTASQKHK